MPYEVGVIAIFGAALGLCIGSFIAAATLRWSTGRSLGGRSGCETCATQLRWFELVPLASYAVLAGRCGHCGAAIGRRQPVIELLAGAIGAGALVLLPGVAGIIVPTIAWAVLALAVWLVERPRLKS